MAFRETQLGRFGSVILNHFNLRQSSPDPDQQAAHLYAIDGVFNTNRPTVDQIAQSKGMWNHETSSEWSAWSAQFRNLYNKYATLVSPLAL